MFSRGMDRRLELRFDAAWTRKKKEGKESGNCRVLIERCGGGATRLTLMMFDVPFRLCSHSQSEL
jgi:hypothetical protein